MSCSSCSSIGSGGGIWDAIGNRRGGSIGIESNRIVYKKYRVLYNAGYLNEINTSGDPTIITNVNRINTLTRSRPEVRNTK